jgi:hypothetical protein
MNKHFTFIATNPPITLSWEDETDTAQPRLLTQGERFVCGSCGTDITRASLRIAVDGSHRHMLPRSFGLDQEHGCFSLAPGCLVQASPLNLLFAKPASGQWHMATCAGCGAPMGWYHLAPGGHGFFLLILESLRAAEDTDESGRDAP